MPKPLSADVLAAAERARAKLRSGNTGLSDEELGALQLWRWAEEGEATGVREHLMKRPGWGLSVRGVECFRVTPFIGAGWSRPRVRCYRYQVAVYFHCGRGLYLQIGWDEKDRQWNRRIAAMPAEERQAMTKVLMDAFPWLKK